MNEYELKEEINRLKKIIHDTEQSRDFWREKALRLKKKLKGELKNDLR